MKRQVETAYAVNVGHCDDPQCPAVHIELLDRSGQAFAQVTISVNDELLGFMQRLRDVAYRIAVLRDGE